MDVCWNGLADFPSKRAPNCHSSAVERLALNQVVEGSIPSGNVNYLSSAVERLALNQVVVGSIPTDGGTELRGLFKTFFLRP